MLIPELSEKSEKKRTALYLDMELYEEIEEFATEQKTSVNKAVLYMVEKFLNELAEA